MWGSRMRKIKFVARKGWRFWEWQVALYLLPKNAKPGCMLWAIGFNSGYDIEHNARGLHLYWGYRNICIYAIAEQQFEERRLLLSSLREQYLAVRLRVPFL